MKQGKNTAVWAVLIVVALLLTAQNIYLYSRQTSSGEPAAEEGQWECAQTACSRLMTPEEIVSTVCFLDEQQQFMCSLNVNGQQGLVPMDQLNLTALMLCAELRCVSEVMARPADYPIGAGLI